MRVYAAGFEQHAAVMQDLRGCYAAGSEQHAFVMQDLNRVYGAGSEQHAYVMQDLANVNRSLTPWLVVGGHRPFYIDSTNNMEPDGDQPVATALREAFEETFYNYQVALQHSGDLCW